MPDSTVTPSGVNFGRYRLVEKLGEGGMGSVHRALVEGPEGFSRPVVIKRILPELSRDPRFVKRFLAEARLCARLHHPGIVQVHALGELDGEYFLAMEFVEGLNLARTLERAYELGRPVPPGVACFLASEVAAALAYAHALIDEGGRPLEIVHRDVSPSNIMVTRHGAVKLLDFGIARVAARARDPDDKTRTGQLKGKVGYMSPEQAEGLPVDGRSDLFALGIVLYECLTLEPLFDGDDSFETLRLVREARAQAPSSRRPDIDPEIDAVVLRLLERAPEARYRTGDDVVAALAPIIHRLHGDASGLRQFVAGLGTAERQVALSPTLARESTITHSGELAARAPRPAARRRTLGIAVAAMAAVALLVGAARLFRVERVTSEVAAPTPPVVAARPWPAVAAPPPAVAEPSPASVAQSAAVRRVRLTVRGTDGAEVRVDGQLVGLIPLELELAPVTHARSVVIESAGHQPLIRSVPGDADAIVDAAFGRRRVTHRAPGPRPEDPEIKDPF